MPIRRLTITLPSQLVRDIERFERNRGRFILQAVRRELERRRRADLRLSLGNPHPETDEVADAGLMEWADRLPKEAIADLVKPDSGKPVRWLPGKGWVEVSH